MFSWQADAFHCIIREKERGEILCQCRTKNKSKNDTLKVIYKKLYTKNGTQKCDTKIRLKNVTHKYRTKISHKNVTQKHDIKNIIYSLGKKRVSHKGKFPPVRQNIELTL